VIPEPQKTYVLELLQALGPASEDFIIAGAQAIKFMLTKARGTKDIDFVLDVRHLREKPPGLGERLAELRYDVVPGSNNFQFEKPIPNSNEVMRIEFMAPEEFKRAKDFRVDVDQGVHARFCIGGSIAIRESSTHQLSGRLPDGSNFTVPVRVTKPHALVMLKLLALDDRYRNIRGPAHAEHDRQEAGTHAADIVAVISGQPDPQQFKQNFLAQFADDPGMGFRVMKVLNDYFREDTSPGLLVYEESIVANQPVDRAARQRVSEEIGRAHRMMADVIPGREFYTLLVAIENCSNPERNRALSESFLSNLKQAGLKITDPLALELIPGEAFGIALRNHGTFITSSAEAAPKISAAEKSLLSSHLSSRAETLGRDLGFRERFASVLIEA
jgi:hypothetical protein